MSRDAGLDVLSTLARNIPAIAAHLDDAVEGRPGALIGPAVEILSMVARHIPAAAELLGALEDGSEEARTRVRDILPTREGASGQAAADIAALGEPEPA